MHATAPQGLSYRFRDFFVSEREAIAMREWLRDCERHDLANSLTMVMIEAVDNMYAGGVVQFITDGFYF